jgi:hypothetical protein
MVTRTQLRKVLVVSSFAFATLSGNTHADDATFNQNLKAAQAEYKQQPKEADSARMRQYQENAGNHVQGPLEAKVAPKTYVAPTYSNGTGGAKVTIETK